MLGTKKHILQSISGLLKPSFRKGKLFFGVKQLLVFVSLFSFLVTASAQTFSIDFYVSENASTAGFNNIDIEKAKAASTDIPLKSAVIYIKKGTLLFNQDSLSQASVVFENTKKVESYKTLLKNQISEKPETQHSVAKATITSLPLGSKGGNSLLYGAGRSFATINTQVENNTHYKAITTHQRALYFTKTEKKCSNNVLFCAQLSPKEKHNRYFSLPPP